MVDGFGFAAASEHPLADPSTNDYGHFDLPPVSAAADESGQKKPEPAVVADVMFDQLQFLLDHSSNCQLSGCPLCGRFEYVKSWLMLPFAEGTKQ
jgi:hypothetical protein